ncbi:hypothetical protein AB0J21_04990 [Streptomyces sp. NPDC049954]|uniref:DUF7144 family membrane protein n=1 Tax=Streptomyces sp. NPDC049954 TaxID=3155779 RepID=UPI003413152C
MSSAPYDPTHSPGPESPSRHGTTGGRTPGLVVFAAVLLMVNGLLGVLNGIAGIAEDDVYTRVNGYVFKFDLTTWGWIHLVVGALAVIAGAGVLSGKGWAKGVGIVLAVCALVANFMWLPYLPLWALVSIALSVVVLWALCSDTDGGGRRG